MQMRWACNQFVHWRVPARRLARLLPPGLELDLHDGEAWASAVALRTQATRLGPLPLGNQDYAQVNLRTYVRRGGTPGLYLLATFCSDAETTAGARALGLPYWHADVAVHDAGVRVGGRGYAATVQPEGEAPDGIDRFLTERRSLFTQVGRYLVRFDALHGPWALRRARAEVVSAKAFPRRLRRHAPDLAHVAADMPVQLARPGRIRIET